MRLSCGVLVTDGTHLLIGHAARSPRWDIPKGVAEPGEADEAAARRELREETGLAAGVLRPLGRRRYMPGKDLSLFVWRVDAMPDPAGLRCTTRIRLGDAWLPELDRFAAPPLATALGMVGKNMARVLGEVWPTLPG